MIDSRALYLNEWGRRWLQSKKLVEIGTFTAKSWCRLHWWYEALPAVRPAR